MLDVAARGSSQHSFRWNACAISLAAHVLTACLALWVAADPRSDASGAAVRPRSPRDLVFVVTPGLLEPLDPTGGGGGGDASADATQVRLPGDNRLTVPAAGSISTSPDSIRDPPVTPVIIPVRPMAAGLYSTPGAIEAAATTDTMRGPGSGSGAGGGQGSGIDGGDGAGLGPGSGQNMGGGPSGLGTGVIPPRVLQEVKPNYTAEAMRAKMQGLVLVECLVLPDGTVGEARVIKSLDRAFGLDEEALEAAKRWRFVPARRQGVAVPVVVTIEVAFTLR